MKLEKCPATWLAVCQNLGRQPDLDLLSRPVLLNWSTSAIRSVDVQKVTSRKIQENGREVHRLMVHTCYMVSTIDVPYQHKSNVVDIIYCLSGIIAGCVNLVLHESKQFLTMEKHFICIVGYWFNEGGRDNKCVCACMCVFICMFKSNENIEMKMNGVD